MWGSSKGWETLRLDCLLGEGNPDYMLSCVTYVTEEHFKVEVSRDVAGGLGSRSKKWKLV